MAVRRSARLGGDTSGKNRIRRRMGFIAAILLTLAACSSGGNTPSGSRSGSPAPPPQASATPTPAPTGSPAKPFTDSELAAIINGVGHTRNIPYPPAEDSTRLRSGAASGSFPVTSTETTPPDCLALVPQDPFTRWADKGINFAEGGMPPAGGESSPTTTIMIILRSAEKDAIAKADFGYTDDTLRNCNNFDLAYTEAGRNSTQAVQLLAAPPLADRQHAYTQVTKPKGPGDYGSVGLRVLAGTLSITLNLAVATLNSGSDAQPALDAMAGLAKELINQSVTTAPSMAAPAPNSLTPDQLVALFRGMTGPGGEAVTLPQATVLGQSPGFAPGQSSPASGSPCTFDEQSYTASLVGSVYGQGQIQGANKSDYTDFMAINMPSTMTPPYPFDSRAEQLHGCTSIRESLSEGGGRTWSPVSALGSTANADSSYGVTFQLSDGTGEWHLQSGARKGTLSIEARSVAASQSDLQAKADELNAFFSSVFSRAGK